MSNFWRHLKTRSKGDRNKVDGAAQEPSLELLEEDAKGKNGGNGKFATMIMGASTTVTSYSTGAGDKMIGMDIEAGCPTHAPEEAVLPEAAVAVVPPQDVTSHHSEQDDNMSFASSDGSVRRRLASNRTTCMIAALILMVGAGASGIILGAGISAGRRDQQSQFERLSLDLMQTFETAVDDYIMAGLWIHQACVSRRDTMTHEEFRVVYEYLQSTGLEMQAITFAMNVTSPEERASVENRTRAYLQENYPDMAYNGFKGFQEDGTVGPRPTNTSYYYNVHFVEPMEDPKNQVALDFDIRTSAVRRQAIEQAVHTRQPAMTTRLKLIQEGQEGTEAYAYSTIIMHPGVATPLSNATPAAARRQVGDVTLVVIRIPEVLERARQNFHNLKQHASLYIFDSTDSDAFIGGALFRSDDQIETDGGGTGVEFTNELELEELRTQSYRYSHEKSISIASREWTFVVVACDESFTPAITFVVLGATLVFVACLLLALGMMSHHYRVQKIQQIKTQSDAERAKLQVENARAAAQKERELSDFLSHEVRNPISAAISACSFVQSALDDCRNKKTNDKYFMEEGDFECVEEDVAIIDSSLQFVNDLLRNMLDMHRASSNQMKIEMEPVDLLRDVLEPVASILYQRGADFEVLLDCPENLIVMTDKLRLKQTALNLGRNATKFVSKGFVRLRAAVVENKVHLYIEDSGPGIPPEKRKNLFGQFQETLDSLSQGTGMGLSLCLKLVELMGGDLSLDESYDSGLPGSPGACFVINMNTPALNFDQLAATEEECDRLIMSPTSSVGKDNNHQENCRHDGEESRQLPTNLSVLFCDDDWKLRTLFSRALGRVTTGWKIREASNGETALRLVEEETFDVIFMDQYFSSVVKQLLGTETVHSMRSRGVSSTICGLSSNDVEKPFLQAGADCFLLKPLPTQTSELTKVLFQIMDSGKARGGASKPRPSLLSKSPRPQNSQKSADRSSDAATAETSSVSSFDLAEALPQHLSVLFVDDDDQLRSLYCRSLRRIAPGWTIQAVGDGQSALEAVRGNNNTIPDLIFIDMYMPQQTTSNKPMLGTEVAQAMRNAGVKSIICGLSANNVKREFRAAGADCFQMKPFPCEKAELTRELVRILGIAATSAPFSQGQTVPSVLLPSSPQPQPPSSSFRSNASSTSLPSNISVLFVDDSPTLRKMFSRCIKRATTDWTVHEADCGEAALKVITTKNQNFDLIFLDQHTNTPLLGTDAARALRQQGVNSVICGLSGDAIESAFLEAGADCFSIKPFPCERDAMAAELARVLSSSTRAQRLHNLVAAGTAH